MTDISSDTVFIVVDKKMPRVNNEIWKHLPDPNTRYEIESKYSKYLEKHASNLSNLDSLIDKYNLKGHEGELRIFWFYLLSVWERTKVIIDSSILNPEEKENGRSKEDGQSRDQYDAQLNELKSFVQENKEVSRITISDKTGTSVTLTNKLLLSWLQTYFDVQGTRKIIKGLTPLKKLQPDIRDKRSLPSKYLKDHAVPFKQYLKAYVYQDKSVNFINLFVYEFLVSLGIDWKSYFQNTGEDIKGYLKKRI